jgi:hypothetical protein
VNATGSASTVSGLAAVLAEQALSARLRDPDYR